MFQFNLLSKMLHKCTQHSNQHKCILICNKVSINYTSCNFSKYIALLNYRYESKLWRICWTTTWNETTVYAKSKCSNESDEWSTESSTSIFSPSWSKPTSTKFSIPSATKSTAYSTYNGYATTTTAATAATTTTTAATTSHAKANAKSPTTTTRASLWFATTTLLICLCTNPQNVFK
uniref:Uncharacterized protein n=1 Tax=Sipha flava TaxID=143950 RepID=A0A2S2QVT6_9HEMI